MNSCLIRSIIIKHFFKSKELNIIFLINFNFIEIIKNDKITEKPIFTDEKYYLSRN